MKPLGRSLALVSLSLLLPLAACGGTNTPTAEVSDTATAEPTPTPEKTDPTDPTESPSPAAEETEAESGFLNANAGAPWADQVTSVDDGEAGRLTVETSIVDPRGDDGSVEARTALKICRAAVSYLTEEGTSEPYVAVREDDGTTFVVASPAVDGGECSEY